MKLQKMKPKKLLLVDDDEAFNYLNRIILNNAGVDCEISACLDGMAALEFATNSGQRPDIILLDINMPVMDGFEFLDEFEKRNYSRHTAVFMLTSSNQDEDRTGALKYSCVKGYFDKPLTEQNVDHIISILGKPDTA